MEIDYRRFYSRVEQTRMEYANKLHVFTKREVEMLDLFAVLMFKILQNVTNAVIDASVVLLFLIIIKVESIANNKLVFEGQFLIFSLIYFL